MEMTRVFGVMAFSSAATRSCGLRAGAVTATGFTTTYTDQLFFYIPGQGSSEKIRLLGYGSSILEAKVIK